MTSSAATMLGADRAVDRASPLPLWAQVLADLSERLAAGDFDPGFPTDQELVAAYGVSRQTAREAVRRLVDQGLLARERGRGTRVRRLAFEHRPGTLEGLFHQVEAQGATQTSIVRVCRETRDAEIAHRLKLPAGEPLVEIERLRLADGEPLALDRSLLPARVSAVCPTAHARLALEIGADVAALAIERLVHSNDAPVEWRQSLVRGDRYSLVVELSSLRVGQPSDRKSTRLNSS